MSDVLLYRTTIDIGDVTVRQLSDLLEELREVAHVEYDSESCEATLTYQVGGTDGEYAAQDLWDLRTVIDEQNAMLEGYVANGGLIGKPKQVDDDE